MTKRLDENSAVNTVAARLVVYVALAGAAGASVAVALRRRHRKTAAADSADEADPAAAGLLTTEFYLDDEGQGASVKTMRDAVPPSDAMTSATAEPGRAGIA
jgi:hypothetical protein